MCEWGIVEWDIKWEGCFSWWGFDRVYFLAVDELVWGGLAGFWDLEDAVWTGKGYMQYIWHFAI